MKKYTDEIIETKIEAKVFQKLKQHLKTRTDVQNIDLMRLAGFCRNCLSRWYQEAALDCGISMSKDNARETFYEMPYNDWIKKFQTEEKNSSEDIKSYD